MMDNIPPETDRAALGPEERLAYAHRPKPISSGLELVLLQDSLRAERSRSSQSVALKAIERITLSFTPKNTAQQAFTCALLVSDGRTIKFHNISWKSLVEVQRLDAEFTGFVRALIQKVATANPRVELRAGVSKWRYSLMMVSGAAIIIGLTTAAIYAMARQNTIIGLMSLGLTVYLGFWLKGFLSRNRPRLFTPETIPPEVMPG